MTPNDRKYGRTHEWIRLDGVVAVIGITDHAQKELGDITFVEPAAVGKRLGAGGECGVIESVKAASDIYAPIAGTVAEVNARLDGAPDLVNKDPYGAGWILKLKDFDADQLDALLDAAGYEATLKA